MHAFSFFGAVALSIVYDNDRCLVSRIERDGNVGAPALAACLVAGITALVLVVLLALIRFVVRFGAEVTAAAAEGAAGS